MSLIDKITDGFNKVLPQKKPKMHRNSAPLELGGSSTQQRDKDNGDEQFSKPAIVYHASEAFFNFLALCCMAAVAAFQAKWLGAPSSLSGFAIFCGVLGILLPLFMLLVPVIYDKYNKFVGLARALRELRIILILTGFGTGLNLIIAFAVTISVYTQAGCKDAASDPSASLGMDFQAGLEGWCATKKAASAFFWFAFVFWVASLVLLLLHYRSGRITRTSRGENDTRRARDPPFDHTQLNPNVVRGATETEDGETEVGDEESLYERGAPPLAHRTSSYHEYAPAGVPRLTSGIYDDSPMPRPSIDTYGAFNDPPPSGFAPPPQVREAIQDDEPRISRTMQYADPYAAARAHVATSPPRGPPPSNPPSYDYHPDFR